MARFDSCNGFGLVESLVVLSLMSIGVLFAMPFAGTMIRRAEGVGAINKIQATLASARLQAVKTGGNVVVVISRSADNAIHLETFRDKASLTAADATHDGNCVQDSGEPSLSPALDIDTHVHFWKYGGTRDDLATAAAFDGYVVGDSVNADLTNRIVFLPTGGIAAPKNANSGSPQPTAPFGRGLYFADSMGKNYFRITISNTIASGARVDKYIPGQGYVSGAWGWQ
jgi:prepilin-type N-terminal cleavage/methylation domain-containing protein